MGKERQALKKIKVNIFYGVQFKICLCSGIVAAKLRVQNPPGCHGRLHKLYQIPDNGETMTIQTSQVLDLCGTQKQAETEWKS